MADEHIIVYCDDHGNEYDMDYEPPLFCCDDDKWNIRIEYHDHPPRETERTTKRKSNVDFSAIE